MDIAAPAGASTFQSWFGSYEGGQGVRWAAGISTWDSTTASYVFTERLLTDSTQYQAAVLEVRFLRPPTSCQHGHCAAQLTVWPRDPAGIQGRHIKDYVQVCKTAIPR